MSEHLRISEKNAENKRGRPAKFDPMQYAMATTIYGARSARGQQNLIYATRAIEVLKTKGEQHFGFLLLPKPKMTILAELGRHKSPKTIVQLAAGICVQKLSAKAAVDLIRIFRGSIKSEPTVYGLKMAMLASINNYKRRHPTLKREMVDEAIKEFKLGPPPPPQ